MVTISGFEDVPENDESALKKAAAHQPVSVAIEADQKSFQLYMGGVYSDEGCGTDLDHGVLVVGYGKDPEEGPYWIVKNSWGADWGDKVRAKGMERVEGVWSNWLWVVWGGERVMGISNAATFRVG